jgi:hypothetical protein
MLNELQEFKDDISPETIRISDDNIAHGSIGRRLLFVVARGYLFLPTIDDVLQSPRDLSSLSSEERRSITAKTYRALQAYVSVNLDDIKVIVDKYASEEKKKEFATIFKREDHFGTGNNTNVYYDDKEGEFSSLVKNGNGVLARSAIYRINNLKSDPKAETKLQNLAEYLVKISTSIQDFNKSFFSGEKVGDFGTIMFDSILAEAYNAGPLRNYRVSIKKDDVDRLFDPKIMINRDHWRLLMYFLALLKVLETNKRKALPNCQNDFVQITLADVKTWLHNKKTLEGSESDPFYYASTCPIKGKESNGRPLFLKTGSKSKLPMFALNPILFDAMNIEIIDSNHWVPFNDSSSYYIVDGSLKKGLQQDKIGNE